MLSSFQLIEFSIFTIWLIVLSFFLLKIHSSLKSIFKESKEQTVISVLSSLTKEGDAANKEIASLINRVASLEEKSLSNIHKIGLIRFNPFGDTGGEQSFILALLDAKDSGVVLSGLYSRSGMRWYIKKIKEGKGVEHELSIEEKKAVESAK
jgi:hypothetical protein